MTGRSALMISCMLGAACGAPRPDAAVPEPGGRSPRVGAIWDVAAGRIIDRDALVARVLRARIVLLGETHDNPGHHGGQADLLRALIAAGRRPAVAFEMLETDQQATLDAARAAGTRDPDAIAGAVGWERSGWPPFRLYRPIFARALEANLRIVAANLPKEQARSLVRQGLAALDPARAAALELDRPLDAATQAALEQEMAESHCGMLPPEMLGGMVLAQRARDATMAEVLEAARTEGAVAIVGAGHARKDRGIPAYLPIDLPVLSIAWLEATDPPEPNQPYDIAIFTPPHPREDPCAAFSDRGHVPGS
jgi:uncharacterized iron-regulated protein